MVKTKMLRQFRGVNYRLMGWGSTKEAAKRLLATLSTHYRIIKAVGGYRAYSSWD